MSATLVFGDDGSLEADRAWLWVIQQKWSGWGLDVMTCRTPSFGPPLDPERVRPHVWSPPTVREIDPTAGFESVRYLLAEADPRVVLTESKNAGLVVVGRKGRGALKALHLGSTAEYVVQHLAAPVVVAKKATVVRSVLVCVDGSVHARKAVEALVSMPWLNQVETMAVIGSYLVGMYDPRAEIEAAVVSAVERLTEAPGLHCIPKPVLRESVPTTAIIGRADAMEADLIVMGTKGQSRLKNGLLWGSVARSVIKTAEMSVLVAHEGEAGGVPDP